MSEIVAPGTFMEVFDDYRRLLAPTTVNTGVVFWPTCNGCLLCHEEYMPLFNPGDPVTISERDVVTRGYLKRIEDLPREYQTLIGVEVFYRNYMESAAAKTANISDFLEWEDRLEYRPAESWFGRFLKWLRRE